MPMPVSATEKATERPSAVNAAATRTSPRSVNLIALEIKFRRIWDTLPSSVCMRGITHRLVEDKVHDVRDQEWPQHAAQER